VATSRDRERIDNIATLANDNIGTKEELGEKRSGDEEKRVDERNLQGGRRGRS